MDGPARPRSPHRARCMASSPLPPAACCAAASARPNLMWIMADDLGLGETGFARPHRPQPPHSNLRDISTPHLDAFARGAMTFDAAYAGYTVCAPSRTTLFTGRHSGHFVRVPTEPTLPERLRAAGYQTAAFGKSAPMDAPKGGTSWTPRVLEWGLPTLYGFDSFLGQPVQTRGHNMYPADVTDQTSVLPLPLNTKPKSRSLCMANPSAYNYTTDIFTAAALRWLETGRTASKPFFLYLSYTVPHAGGWGSWPRAPEDGNPVPSDLQYAAELSWPEVERDHAASVSYLDARIGEILRELERLELSSNTVVWFASDNGPHNEGGHSVDFFSSSGGLRGYKRSLYEGGVRSPSIVRWPGVTQSGSRSTTPWSFWDVLPTMMEIAGVKADANMYTTDSDVGVDASAKRHGLDGRSIVPALRGESQPPPRYMFWTWRTAKTEAEEASAHEVGSSFVGRNITVAAVPSGYAARMGDWKVVVHHCVDTRAVPSMDDVAELYHLPSDPGETKDMANCHKALVRSMLSILADPKEALSCACFQC